MAKFINRVGEIYSNLTIIEYVGRNKNKAALWKCRCICLNEITLEIHKLIDGNIKCCGCTRNGIPFGVRAKDLTGMIFGRLTVLKYLGSHNRETRWLCKCDCESKTEISVMTCNLTTGNTQSCGCLRLERVIKASTTHGMTGTIEYHSWWSMRSRCYNKKNNRYDKYGGRGIKVCDRWKDSFENFLEDMGKCPENKNSIDRKNLDGHYCKDNCEWADDFEQANNKSNNIRVEYDSISYTIGQLARKINMNPNTLRGRIVNGWRIDEAIKTPVKSRKKKQDLKLES